MPENVTRVECTAVTSSPETLDVDMLFVPVYLDDEGLETVPGLADATGGEWARARASREFRAKAFETFTTGLSSPWKARRVTFVGAGLRGEQTAERLRRVAAACSYIARQRALSSAAILVRVTGEDALRHAAMFADGLSAAEFDSGTYKTGERDAGFPPRISIVAPEADAPALAAAVRRGRILGGAANFARTLANEPANVLTPRVFVERVVAGMTEVGLETEVLDADKMRGLGMNLLLAVAQGSAEPPYMMVIRHSPKDAPSVPTYALVGKGVTFDTGGISIKPADGMERMKDDMAGGAAVAAAMRALAQLNAPFRVIGLIPTVENMPGGRASRPGDVVAGASGKTVEIINTDAEGRLILADALWYAQELGATHIIDVATLTGAIVVALGRHVSGLFGAPVEWVDRVRDAAAAAGDRVWPMPIYEEAKEQLRSEIADIVNSAGRPGGAVTAAAFLREFAGNTSWVHLDIAGTAWAETKSSHQPKGATGVAVRTLVEVASKPIRG